MLILQNFFRGPRSNQAPITQYIGSTANSEGLANIMVSDQDPDIPFTQVADDPLDVQNRDRVYAGEGFVEQHE